MNQDYVSRTRSQDSRKEPRVIKRYGNRKLYDTEQSSYVVLSDIEKMVRNNEDIRVIDNETKDDITSTALTKIIFEAERKSSCCAPLELLRNIITKGDGSLSNFLAELGLFTPTTPKEASVSQQNTATYKTTPTLEERLASSVNYSHDIVEENELPELPKANKHLDQTNS